MRPPPGHRSGSRRVRVPQAGQARRADVASAPSVVPTVTLSPAGPAGRHSDPAEAPTRPAAPTEASVPPPRSPGGPAQWERGRAGAYTRAGDPCPPPRGGPSPAAPGKGGAAHQSLGWRLQGPARRRKLPAEAAPPARSTRAAILLQRLGSHRPGSR